MSRPALKRLPLNRSGAIGRIVAGIALAGVLVPATGPVRAQAPSAQNWLILQSAADPLAVAGAQAARRSPGARVMASDDCAEMRPGLYVLAQPAEAHRSSPQPAGTYVKRCTPKAGSLTARGIAVVDPSFAAMREAPINFAGTDMVSSIRSGLLIRPWYVQAPEDPREGLRVAVDDVTGGRRPIERDCTAPEVARTRTHIAIACAIEQVGEQYLYRTTVYRATDLARIRTIPRCRTPQLAPGSIRCLGQSVSANGKVTTTAARTVPL